MALSKFDLQRRAVSDSIPLDYVLEGNLDDVIQSLQRLQEENKHYENRYISIGIDRYSGSYYDNSNNCSCTVDSRLHLSRMETDEEYQTRIDSLKELEKQQRAKLNQKAKEKKIAEKELYEKLKVKYEGK